MLNARTATANKDLDIKGPPSLVASVNSVASGWLTAVRVRTTARTHRSSRVSGCYWYSACSASSSASTATMAIPSAFVILVAADTVRGVPTIGATAIRMS